MSRFGNAATTVVKKVVALAPDRWMPGGKPDPLIGRERGLIGSPVSRVDGPLKVRGEARFAAEFPLDGMVYAALVFSTIPKGRIASARHERRRGRAGRRAGDDAPQRARIEGDAVLHGGGKAAAGDNLPIMQDDRVHWNGEPIAVVLAETQEQANHAKTLLRVTYEAEPAVTSFDRPRPPACTGRSLPGEALEARGQGRRSGAGGGALPESTRFTRRRATTTTPSSRTR